MSGYVFRPWIATTTLGLILVSQDRIFEAPDRLSPVISGPLVTHFESRHYLAPVTQHIEVVILKTMDLSQQIRRQQYQLLCGLCVRINTVSV